MILDVLTVAAVMVLAGVVAWCAWRRDHPRGMVGRTVVVNTRSGESLRGVLVADHADRVSLRDAVYLRAGAEVAIDGLAHVPRGSVSWVQEPAG